MEHTHNEDFACILIGPKMCYRADVFRVSTKTVRLRNVEKTEWSLVAQTFIPSNTFLMGFIRVFLTLMKERVYTLCIIMIFQPNYQN